MHYFRSLLQALNITFLLNNSRPSSCTGLCGTNNYVPFAYNVYSYQCDLQRKIYKNGATIAKTVRGPIKTFSLFKKQSNFQFKSKIKNDIASIWF